MRRNLYWTVTVIAASLLETTWVEAIRVMDVVPNLTLLLVVYFGVMNGPERAMFTGLLGGLFNDVASNAVLGHHVLCYVIVGYLVGRISARLATEHPAVKAGLVFLSGLAFGLISTTVAYVQDPGIGAVHDIAARVVPGAFYSALFTPVLFFVLDFSFRREDWAAHGGTA